MPSTLNNPDELLKLAQKCDIGIPDHILAAVRSAPEGSKLTQWVELVNHTLRVSQSDRRRAEMILRRGGQADDMDELLNLLVESKLERAIQTLDASSQQLSSQSGILLTQQTLLSAYRAEPSNPHGKLRYANSCKTTGEAQSTRVLNEAKLHDLTHDIQNRLDALDRDAKGLPAAVRERLKADDRIIELLYKGTDGPASDMNLSDLSGRIQQVAGILQTKRVSSLKDKLDRVYLTALTETPPNGLALAEAAEAIPELKLDIQSLYTEIDDVVAMTVGEEHVNRLQQRLLGISLRQQREVEQALRDTKTRIARITAQLRNLTSQINRVQSQRLALSELLGYTAETNSAALFDADQSTQVPQETDLPRTAETEVSALDSISQDPFDSALLRLTLVSITKALETARIQRAEAVGLLHAVGNPTDTALLDALDGRIASTSKAFDKIAR